ncbi:hypothetical protein ANN_27896, partial [Periplaneta americana]
KIRTKYLKITNSNEYYNIILQIFNMGKYQRKTDQKPFSQEQLDRARELLRNGESQRAVARALDVHEAILQKRLTSGKAADSLGRFQKVFDSDMEKELEKHIQDLESRFYGLTRKQLMRIAFEFTTPNGIHPFNSEKKLASKDWVMNFCKGHGLSLRTPEQCSLGRAMGFNRIKVKIFFVI